MNFFKSRYTASLEEQVAELKAEKKVLQEQVSRLLAAVQEWRGQGGRALNTTEDAGKTNKKAAPPRRGNWLNTCS